MYVEHHYHGETAEGLRKSLHQRLMKMQDEATQRLQWLKTKGGSKSAIAIQKERVDVLSNEVKFLRELKISGKDLEGA